MKDAHFATRSHGLVGLLGLLSLLAAGCGEAVVKSDVTGSGQPARSANETGAAATDRTGSSEEAKDAVTHGTADITQTSHTTAPSRSTDPAPTNVATVSSESSTSEPPASSEPPALAGGAPAATTDASAPPSATQRPTTDATPPKKPDATPSGPRKVEILVKDRTFKPEGKDGALRVSYDDIDLLKVINMDPVTTDAVEKMPGWLRQLNGKRIRIRGFMYPPYQETGITSFVLARDNQICCFGRDPKVYDLIRIRMKSGTSVDYIQNRPFDVIGTFRIAMDALDDGTIFGLYNIDDAVVIEK
jgi:hypothetical protein